MRRRVKVGEEFSGSIEVIDAKRLLIQEMTRSWLVRGIAIAIFVALLLAAVYGWFVDSFDSLRAVWATVAMPMGAILQCYFGENTLKRLE